MPNNLKISIGSNTYTDFDDNGMEKPVWKIGDIAHVTRTEVAPHGPNYYSLGSYITRGQDGVWENDTRTFNMGFYKINQIRGEYALVSSVDHNTLAADKVNDPHTYEYLLG